MESHKIFTALRDNLADLFATQDTSRRIVAEAGIDAKRVTFSNRSITNWHNILNEAIQQNRLGELLKVAHEEYSGNPELSTIYSEYQRLIAQGVSFEAQAQLSADDTYQVLTSKIRTLTDAIDQLPDLDTKEILRKQLGEYEKLAKEASEGELERQREEFILKLAQQKAVFEQDQAVKQSELRLRESETKTRRIIRLLDKDLVSVLIGGVLLIILTVSLIVLMSRGIVEPRLLENAFLILLGYFFGQGVGARISTTASADPKETHREIR